MTLTQKYRPSKLSQVVGQDKPIKTLTNAIARNKQSSFFLSHLNGISQLSYLTIECQDVR